MAGYKLCILTWVLSLAIGLSLAASGATLKLAKARSDVLHGSNNLPRSPADCQAARYDFSSQATGFERDWLPLDSPQSYALGSDGLNLFLDRPSGRITSKGNVNSKVAEGSTFNSTFTLKYGKVTYTLSGADVAGVVTAAILIADEHDEIDIELVGGDPNHWQTNVFAPAPHEKQPLYATFGATHNYARSAKSVSAVHSYTIDWSPEQIVWRVDGTEVRTLRKEDTKKKGVLHYPSHPARLQFGIWDASAPAGTSEWAHGPIDWDLAPRRMSAVFKSVEVECPY